MHTYQNLFESLKKVGLKSNDVLMIHSSYKSIGEVENKDKTIINVFCDYFKDGLILFPTHTWATMKEDNQIMDKRDTNSCVGYLTNLVINDKRFHRSNHPTHSVAAYGYDALEYIKSDDEAITPTPVFGSFGKLKDYKGYILFIGAPLSKNTFVHSIEEYMEVPDRFTAKKYKFITKVDDTKTLEFNMFRHYNEKCPHISDNYEKLLPIMIKEGIAKEFYFGDALSYLVNAKGCFDLVVEILKKDIHAFDDLREI